MGEDRDATRVLVGKAEPGAGCRRVATAGWNGRKDEVVLSRSRRVSSVECGHILEHRARARVDHAEGIGTGGRYAEVRSGHVEVPVAGIEPRLVTAPDRHDLDVARHRQQVNDQRSTAPRDHEVFDGSQRGIVDAEYRSWSGSEPECKTIDVVLLLNRKGANRRIDDCDILLEYRSAHEPPRDGGHDAML